MKFIVIKTETVTNTFIYDIEIKEQGKSRHEKEIMALDRTSEDNYIAVDGKREVKFQVMGKI